MPRCDWLTAASHLRKSQQTVEQDMLGENKGTPAVSFQRFVPAAGKGSRRKNTEIQSTPSDREQLIPVHPQREVRGGGGSKKPRSLLNQTILQHLVRYS